MKAICRLHRTQRSRSTRGNSCQATDCLRFTLYPRKFCSKIKFNSMLGYLVTRTKKHRSIPRNDRITDLYGTAINETGVTAHPFSCSNSHFVQFSCHDPKTVQFPDLPSCWDYRMRQFMISLMQIDSYRSFLAAGAVPLPLA